MMEKMSGNSWIGESEKETDLDEDDRMKQEVASKYKMMHIKMSDKLWFLKRKREYTLFRKSQ